MTLIHCRYCESEHGDLLLCAPARRVLDALYARGQRFDMPTVEFPEPVMEADAFGGGTVLVQQFVAKAGVTEANGVPYPVLILTGRDIAGNVLPEWVYLASAGDMRRTRDLVNDMTEMAIRRARAAQEEAKRGNHH